ncbi:MAG: carboxypeptidase-like regulatory domain-containing protein [Candidatus Thiodiazotropha sp. (ex Monitilora ramsayi)]|nr:carboxypeptidase-like regulatory domain-containing protein [Candidatus Thiodiazotropha sp. (ex Monitilora ramsayi)]
MRLLGLYPFPLFLLLVCWHGTLFGATLSGVIQEVSEALSDVEVMLVNAQSGVVLNRAYTDKAGEFSFTVDRGTYNVGTFKPEYANAWRKGIVVDKDVSIRIEIEPKAFSDDGEAASDDCE